MKRKSGFLAPNFGYAENLGFYGSLPYYWAIAPNMDVTFTPTYLTRQGFLGQVEFRHRLSNGQYAVRVAGISQDNPKVFSCSRAARPARRHQHDRARSYLQPGLDASAGTGRCCRTARSRATMASSTATPTETTSTVHLTGIRDRNYFEARASYYQILTNHGVD